MTWWAWILLGIAFFGLEVFLATDFYLVFLGIAALIVGLLNLFGVSMAGWIQWLLFSVIAVLALVVYRQRFKRMLTTPDREVERGVVGEHASASEVIPAGGRGKVELRGSVWQAANTGTQDLAVGDRCEVVAAEGVLLKVRKAD
jgi:membrane protein implicated in regulation of membrane protease activity